MLFVPSPLFAPSVAQTNLPLEQRFLVFCEFRLETLHIVIVLIREVLSVFHLESASPNRHELTFEDLDWVWLRGWLGQTERFILLGAAVLVDFPRPQI